MSRGCLREGRGGPLQHSLPDPIVFVVDDDPAMRDSLTWLLRSVGLGVETYPSAEEFLGAYSPSRTGCLVLDVDLPGMSGLALQRELTRRESTLPIIFVSGSATAPMAARARQAGALDVVEKPFDDVTILKRIRQALRQEVESGGHNAGSQGPN